MPTSWNERAGNSGGFQEGRPDHSGEGDYYIDFLFEGTGFSGILPPVYVERIAPAPAMSERVGVSTPWTERTI